MRRKAGAFHQRYGNGAFRNSFGDRAATDRSHQQARHDRGLCRASGDSPQACQGYVDEEFRHAGALQKRPERHEWNNELRQHFGHDAEDAVGGEVDVFDDAPDRVALVPDNVGQIVAEQRVENRDDGAERHVHAEHPPRHLDGDDDDDDAHPDIDRRVIAGAIGHLFVVDDPVDDARRRARGEQEIEPGRSVSPVPFPAFV